MRPWLRKLLLTAHIVMSLGWFGAAASILVLGVAGVTSDELTSVHAAYVGTALVWKFVVMPSSVAALATGIIQGIATPWGLTRHWWVIAKLVLVTALVAMLMLHTRSLLPALDMNDAASSHDHGLSPRAHLVVAASGTLLVLLITATLSVYKPWGKRG